MDLQIYLVLLLLLNVLGTLNATEVKYDSDPDVHWENFKTTYKKSYAADDEPIRRKNFEDNYKKMTEHNQRYEQGMHSFQLGCNEYADMLIEDFVKMMNGLIKGESTASIRFGVPTDSVVPDRMDWREKGAVTPIKNQRQCGACFAFSATGSIEGQEQIKNGKLVSLSEQDILDCSRSEGNQGCLGGVMDFAFQYVEKNGIDSEKSYPYKAKEGPCLAKRKKPVTTCYGYSDVVPRNEDTLKFAVGLVGPISVGIDASHDSFQLYRGGIYDEPLCSSTALDHGVLAVGYGSENGTDYWIVKNSWGTTWGEDGYIRMSRNKNNQCGIASQASFPVLL